MIARIRNKYIRSVIRKINEINEVLEVTKYDKSLSHLTYSISYKGDESFTNIDLSKIESEVIDIFRTLDVVEINRHLSVYDRLTSSGNYIVKNLKEFPTVFAKFVATSERQHLYKYDIDGHLLAFAITECSYSPTTRDCAEHVTIRLRNNSISGSSLNIIHIDKFNVDIDISELLAKRGYCLDNADFNIEYDENFKRFLKLVKCVGHQFVGTGNAELVKDRWYSSMINLDELDYPTPLVIDDIKHHDSNSSRKEILNVVTSGISGKEILVPYHHRLRAFDLIKHRFYDIHINNLSEYEYDKHLLDKVVIPDDVKFVLKSLISSGIDSSSDIVKHKSAGKFVLTTGVPGVGKTLTAEAFSEILGVPLYRVQCAQLGIAVNNVEDSLIEVLQRASRWNCVLLIDEADVYIRKRNQDIIQNAIVGTFLRVLEYYDGILFMTSNLGKDIDDAIFSRCSVWIDFKLPEAGHRLRIIEVLSKQFGMTLADDAIEYLSKQELSGRDIKSVLKLAKSLKFDESCKYSLELICACLKFTYNSTRL